MNMKLFGSFTLVLVCFLLCSCTTTPETDYLQYRSYENELKSREQVLLNTPENQRDPQFNYTPGFVRKPQPEELQFDTETAEVYVENEYILILEDGYSDKQLIDDLISLNIPFMLVGYVPTFSMVQLQSTETFSSLKEHLANIPEVITVKRNYIQMTEDLNSSEISWHIIDYCIQDIWEESRGKGVRVAVIDSGIDASLMQFTGRVVYPYSVVTGSGQMEDQVFTKNHNTERVIDHGTKVASIISAASQLEEPAIGIAPEAEILPIQVFGFSVINEKLFSTDLMIIEAIGRAIEFKADIINLSLGSDYSFIFEENPGLAMNDPKIMNLIEHHASSSSEIYNIPLAICSEKNIPVIVSAGNDGLPASTQPLASHNSTIAVGSIDRDGRVAGFSNFGGEVSCYAPGLKVTVIGAGGNLFSGSGTSFSAPYVSGILALAISRQGPIPNVLIQKALGETNSEGRLSILPYNSTDLFMPTQFYNQLGGNIECSNERLSQYAFFSQQYSYLYIEDDDDSTERLLKIFRFYNRINRIDPVKDPEAIAARQLINSSSDNFDFTVECIKDGYFGDYYIARILSHCDLSNAQLDRINENLMFNDFFAIILNYKSYAGRFEGYRERLLLNAHIFNGNTLLGLGNSKDPEDISLLAEYLQRVQASSSYLTINEYITCYILAYLEDSLQSRVSHRTEELLEVSIQRLIDPEGGLRSNRNNNIDLTCDMYTYMSKAMLLAERKEGLYILLEGLKFLSEEKSPNEEPPSEYYLKNFQDLLNRYVRIEQPFNYQTTPEDRRMQLKRFEEAIEKCEWNGKNWSIPD